MRLLAPSKARLLMLAAAGIALAGWSTRFSRYDPAPWLADLDQLERGASDAFANLEWHIGRGAVDPVALHRRTDSLVRHAGSPRAAAAALRGFMMLLRDNETAVVVGSRTMGAGCGYTGGGVPLRLDHSGLEVHMPDCARFRRSGENEVAGITPDHGAGWTDGESDEDRAAKVLAVLGRIPLRP